METLHEPVGLRAGDFRSLVLDVVEGQVQLVGMRVRAAELLAIIREDLGNRNRGASGIDGRACRWAADLRAASIQASDRTCRRARGRRS